VLAYEPSPFDPAPIPFDKLSLDERLLSGIRDLGWAETRSIQSGVIPLALGGGDVIACAETGTGKTAAFLVPILQRFLNEPPPQPPRTRALVLAPTRELAVQIEDQVQGLTYHTTVSSVAVFGGVPMDSQEFALRAGVDIVVATPGRLMDHMRHESDRLLRPRDPGARRSGSHVGHGLLARRAADPVSAARQAADAALLGDDARRKC
jgi:ATP-dependent RNA helicase RhlE